MPYVCYGRGLGIRESAGRLRQAAFRRAATARSQTTIGFQLTLVWSTNTPNPFAVSILPALIASIVLRCRGGRD